MRLLLLWALLAVSASAQSSDRLGFYGVVGSGSPERALFPDATDPWVVLGVRLTPAVDVQAGIRLDERTIEADLLRSQTGVVLRSQTVRIGDVVERQIRERTNAAAVSIGIAAELGVLALTVRGSAALDRFQQDETTLAVSGTDGGAVSLVTEQRTSSNLQAHGGASVVVALPLRRAAGRVSPGLGLAVSTVGAGNAYTSTAPSTVRLMPFLSVPTTARFEGLDVTLEAVLGFAQGAGSRRARTDQWAPVVEAGIRVDV